MSWLTDTFALYGRVVRRAAELTRGHWWLGLVAIAYMGGFTGAVLLAGSLGVLGGFIITLVFAMLLSSWLVLVGHVVRTGRTTTADVAGSWFVYLGDVVTFGFLLWALQMIASLAFPEQSYGAIVFDLALYVFLSAVPEQIYLASESGVAIFVGSYRFVASYWIEWLPATLLLGTLPAAALFIPVVPIAVVVAGVAVAFMFVARGLLFLELTTSSRRAREFQRRAMG